MNDYDWNAEPSRPLSRADVWEFLRNGANVAEVMAAGHVSELAARGMMLHAARGERAVVLGLKKGGSRE